MTSGFVTYPNEIKFVIKLFVDFTFKKVQKNHYQL